jgi:hypothetical protein
MDPSESLGRIGNDRLVGTAPEFYGNEYCARLTDRGHLGRDCEARGCGNDRVGVRRGRGRDCVDRLDAQAVMSLAVDHDRDRLTSSGGKGRNGSSEL